MSSLTLSVSEPQRQCPSHLNVYSNGKLVCVGLGSGSIICAAATPMFTSTEAAHGKFSLPSSPATQLRRLVLPFSLWRFVPGNLNSTGKYINILNTEYRKWAVGLLAWTYLNFLLLRMPLRREGRVKNSYKLTLSVPKSSCFGLLKNISSCFKKFTMRSKPSVRGSGSAAQSAFEGDFPPLFLQDSRRVLPAPINPVPDQPPLVSLQNFKAAEKY